MLFPGFQMMYFVQILIKYLSVCLSFQELLQPGEPIPHPPEMTFATKHEADDVVPLLIGTKIRAHLVPVVD